MSINILIALIISLLVIAAAVGLLFLYNNRSTKKKSQSRLKNNANHKVARLMVYSACIGLIVGAVIADVVSIQAFKLSGEWNPSTFFMCIFSATLICFMLGAIFGPIYERIKRNLLVRNRDRSVVSVLRSIGKVLLCAGPVLAAFILVFSGVSESLAKLILLVGTLLTTAITGAYTKRRNGKIEKALRKGCKDNSNIEFVGSNHITDHDIMDCVTCDWINRKKNLVIKSDVSDIAFSSVEFVTRLDKSNESEDPAEVIHYKTKKVAKSPIICTFDKELTDAPMQLIETENPAFNKQFFTYCDNAEDAFYVLTPQVMELMVEAAKAYKRLIFNFDGDELFIIIYQNNFMDTLAKQDSDKAFADLKKMVGDLVFKEIALPGYHIQATKESKKVDSHTQETPKKKRHTVLIIVLVIVGVFVLFNVIIFGYAMCSVISERQAKIENTYSEELTTDEINPIQDYLKQKYGTTFTLDGTGYSNRFETDYSTTVHLYLTDANGFKFDATSTIRRRDSQHVEYKDSYQVKQYNAVLEQQIKSLNTNVDSVSFSNDSYNQKFANINEFMSLNECKFFTVYLNDGFGEINENSALDLSKQIVSRLNLKNAYLNYYASKSYGPKCTYRYKDGEFYLS